MWRIYAEGRCRRCGMRVTVDREPDGHTRDGRWCGPVETERSIEVPDQLQPDQWMVPWRGAGRS